MRKRVPVLGIAMALGALVWAAPAGAAGAPRVAVVDFHASAGLDVGEGAQIAAFLRAGLENSGRVLVVSREEIARLLSTPRFQHAGACTTRQCAVDVGRALGVHTVITGSLDQRDSQYVLTLYGIELEAEGAAHTYRVRASELEKLHVAAVLLTLSFVSEGTVEADRIEETLAALGVAASLSKQELYQRAVDSEVFLRQCLTCHDQDTALGLPASEPWRRFVQEHGDVRGFDMSPAEMQELAATFEGVRVRRGDDH